MQEQLLADVQAGKLLDNAARARHRDVPHALAGLGAEPGNNQFAFTAVTYNSSASLSVTGTPAYL